MKTLTIKRGHVYLIESLQNNAVLRHGIAVKGLPGQRFLMLITDGLDVSPREIGKYSTVNLDCIKGEVENESNSDDWQSVSDGVYPIGTETHGMALIRLICVANDRGKESVEICNFVKGYFLKQDDNLILENVTHWKYQNLPDIVL